jgi:hypothetical protein
MSIGFYRTAQNTIPLTQRRGIESIDLNEDLILIQASIKDVSETAQYQFQMSLERDIWGMSINTNQQGIIILQLCGHPWTLVIPLPPRPYIFVPGDGSAITNTFSDSLNTKSISYHISDTEGSLSYQLFEKGKLIERLNFNYNDGINTKHIGCNQTFGCAEFESQIRSFEPQYIILNAYSITYDFFKAQNIYLPSFIWSNVHPGKRVKFRISGLSYLDFVRVDYLTT